MSAIQFELPDSRVLDLFAGSGALGIEALSRGAAHATFVENSVRVLPVLRRNLAMLGASESAEIVRKAALAYAATLDEFAFDIALADPPYGQNLAAQLAAIFLERKFAHMLWVEHRTGEEMPEAEGSRTRKYGSTAITSYQANR